MGTEEEKTMTLEQEIAELKENNATMLGLMEDLIKKVGAVEKVAAAPAKSKGLFGGKRAKTPTKDTVTGIVYPSKAAVGKALAGTKDFPGLDNSLSTVYYQIVAKAPNRFVDATPEEAAIALKKADEDAEKERQERQAKLDKEAAEAAKAQTETPAPAGQKPATPPVNPPANQGNQPKKHGK